MNSATQPVKSIFPLSPGDRITGLYHGEFKFNGTVRSICAASAGMSVDVDPGFVVFGSERESIWVGRTDFENSEIVLVERAHADTEYHPLIGYTVK